MMNTIEKIKVIKNKLYFDNRGYFKEILKEKDFRKRFPFVVMSLSKKNVLRGLHIQLKNPQGKYISVLKGEIFDVGVDLRNGSKTFGKHYTNILSEKNSKSLYIPPGFAHGFVGIGQNNYVIYSCSSYRNRQSEIGIKFDDPILKIKWPGKKFIVSNKDKKNLSFIEFKKKFIK
ncbi:MAG: dTDP-4-dehydrorhamnose 3,5-epimerase [Rickettsiales bacterium TMED289]|nr:MAG: dTDP-4-dehydrorhamnose 3,5-epimerase [Rickettsiales bacterium TMED289]|tara:strand:- start:1007 stop:1528 length:522 start_codon:yes stop_codon:yes gene_type:complete